MPSVPLCFPPFCLYVVDRLTSRTVQIGQFPFSGEFVPEYRNEQIREVIEYSYRIIYYVESEVIYVLAVVHGARLLLETPPLPKS